MGVVVFILIVLVWWFWVSNSEAQEELKKEKNKIENFKMLIENTSRLTQLYSKNYSHSNNVFLIRKYGSTARQVIEISITLKKIYVYINLTDYLGKHNYKNLEYPMPINEYRIAESIKAEFDYFEKTLLSKNPQFYGTIN